MRTANGLLICAWVLITDAAYSGACIAPGSSRGHAIQQFHQQCERQFVDCDRYQQTWYCADQNIDKRSIEAWLQVSNQGNADSTRQDTAIDSSCFQTDGDGSGRNGSAFCMARSNSNNHPAAIDTNAAFTGQQPDCKDPDGDGWGWDGTASCKVRTNNNHLPATNNTPPLTSPPSDCKDPDGDGWGWDGTASCKVQPSGANHSSAGNNNLASADRQSDCSDPDGDGWGWNGVASCRVAPSPTPITEDPVYRPQADTECPANHSPSDITDLILATGQSNLTGADTKVSASLDRFGKVIEFHAPDKPHPRVYAWTVDSYNNNNGTGWKIADLTQSWHDSNPGVGGIARNNFVFHFAKKVASHNGCRIVGFIMVSEGGRGISHWDNNSPGWNEVTRHVNDAMSAIGRTSIDGILWHQGESDWIADGTCYTDSGCHNTQQDYYPQKLYSRIADSTTPNLIGRNSLLDRLRRQSWFGNGKPFIAAETVRAPVNVHLNKLNTDNDIWTATVRGDAASGLGIRADDPHKNHYNAEGLREIGARYATAYLNMQERR